MAIDKSLKELATAILKKNGIDYDKWLTEKYTELILDNVSLLKEGIEENKDTKVEIKNDEVVSNKPSNSKPWEKNNQ